MSWNFKDLSGLRFGRLLVIRQYGTKNHKPLWICKCDCGNEKTVIGENLKNGNTKSCGCFSNDSRIERQTTHGMTKTRIYRIWTGMIQRCTNQSWNNYKKYGARGITVCNRWMESFENFFSDMGDCPANYQIDRIDNNGNYEPSNCRWVSVKDNCRNRRNSRVLTHNGISQTLAAWSEQLHIPTTTLSMRLGSYGWSIEKTLSTPLKKGGNTKHAAK